MKVISCKAVDLWDGGDRQTFGFYISENVSDKEIADANPHCHIRPCLLTIFDTLEERKLLERKNLLRSAWQKLTPHEREALGLLKEPE